MYLPPHLLSKFYKVSVLMGLARVGRGALDTRAGGAILRSASLLLLQFWKAANREAG